MQIIKERDVKTLQRQKIPPEAGPKTSLWQAVLHCKIYYNFLNLACQDEKSDIIMTMKEAKTEGIDDLDVVLDEVFGYLENAHISGTAKNLALRDFLDLRLETIFRKGQNPRAIEFYQGEIAKHSSEIPGYTESARKIDELGARLEGAYGEHISKRTVPEEVKTALHNSIPMFVDMAFRSAGSSPAEKRRRHHIMEELFPSESFPRRSSSRRQK